MDHETLYDLRRVLVNVLPDVDSSFTADERTEANRVIDTIQQIRHGHEVMPAFMGLLLFVGRISRSLNPEVVKAAEEVEYQLRRKVADAT